MFVRIEMPQQQRHVFQMRYGKNGAFTTCYVSAYSDFDAMRRAEQECPGTRKLRSSIRQIFVTR